MQKIKLSLIIPAFNEELIIKKTLKDICQFLSQKKYAWEVVVVNDGSSDRTVNLVKDFSKHNRQVELVSLDKNSGKGAALRAGVSKAKGECIIYSDADLSVSIKNIDKFLKSLSSGFDVAIGSRRVRGSKIEVHQPWLRETLGRGFTFLTRMILMMNIADFTCGFKGFKKEAAKKIFSKGIINRWAYDAEILFLAKKNGYKITQVPITWKNREDTRVVLNNVVFESFKDLILIRVSDLLGKYG